MAVASVLVVDDQHVGRLLVEHGGQGARPPRRRRRRRSCRAGRWWPRRPCRSRGSRGRPGGPRRGSGTPRPAPPGASASDLARGQEALGDLPELAPGGGDQDHPVTLRRPAPPWSRRWRWPRRRGGRGRRRSWPSPAPYWRRRPSTRRRIPAGTVSSRGAGGPRPARAGRRWTARRPMLRARLPGGDREDPARVRTSGSCSVPGPPADHLDRLGPVVTVEDVGAEPPLGPADAQPETITGSPAPQAVPRLGALEVVRRLRGRPVGAARRTAAVDRGRRLADCAAPRGRSGAGARTGRPRR